MEIMYDATYRAGRVTLQHINARPVSPESDFSRQSYDAGGRNSIRTSSSARSSMIQGHNEYVYIPIEFILTHLFRVKTRVSKTVDFGVAQQHQVENETAEWDDILLDHPCCHSCSIT